MILIDSYGWMGNQKCWGKRKALEAYAQMSCTRIVELTSEMSQKAADIGIAMNLGMADSIINHCEGMQR